MTLKRAFAVLIEWKDGLSNEARPVATAVEPGDIIVKPAAGPWHVVAADSTDAEIATAEVAVAFPEVISGTVATAARHATLKDALTAFPADATVAAKVKAVLEAKQIVFRRTVVS